MKLIAALILIITAVIHVSSQTTDIPGELLSEYYSVKKSENSTRKTELALEMEKYMNRTYLTNNDNSILINNSSSETDWYSNDQLVHSGNLSEQTSRALIVKYGEDGNMYLLAALNPQVSVKGRFKIYKSSNGGASWSNVADYNSSNEYFFSVDMLVESRDNNTADSTRIIVYYTSTTDLNGYNAKLNLFSIRRDGSGFYSGIVGTPVAGRKFEQVTCCSDGQYYQNSTYLHAFVKDSPNAGQTNGFRHFMTVNWGSTHTNEMITTDPKDNYPTAQFLATSSQDSVLISFERIFDQNSTGFGIYKTTDVPTTTVSYVLTPMTESGVKNEKPCLTVSQQSPSLEKKMMITYTSGGVPECYYSTNGGKLWNFRPIPGLPTCSYTFCSSDSSSASGQNFVVGYVTLNGDSVMTSRVSAGGLFSFTKINNTSSSPLYVPAFCIYSNANGKFSSSAFAGNSGVNIYFDGEHLLTGIQNINSEIPEEYKLEQNYPNPFNPVTNIKFSVLKSGHVTLKVYDIKGSEIATLVNLQINAGSYEYDFNAANLPSGAYFYRLTAGEFTEVKKMILVK